MKAASQAACARKPSGPIISLSRQDDASVGFSRFGQDTIAMEAANSVRF